MIRLKELKKKLKKNQGNTFIMVVATLSFLAVIVAAILVAVALCYRLKAYDINARDNFYYLEQAMDEIYAGVGADSMQHLNQAYDDTLEVMVYYDTEKKAYVTMDNDKADKILKATYISLLKNDSRYSSSTNVTARLNEFLSYRYDVDSCPEGVQLSVGNVAATDDDVTIYNIVLKRVAQYSTLNARSKKDADASGKTLGAPDTFIQTITTDLVIGKPEFKVNFNMSATDSMEVYGYSMVSDMGIEITGKKGATALGNKVNITGNIYAASDFYNKSYNENPGSVVASEATTVTNEQIQKVNSYDDDKLKTRNGVTKNSMYSGIYVDGASVVMACERLIVPGMIAALNCADVTITSLADTTFGYADVWADGIVLDGYSLKQNVKGTELKGSSINMKARAYIYDDLEMNANSSSFLLNGEYYGYNYASTDNRTYTNDCITKGVRQFTKGTDEGITDGQGIEGQAHYNSSAIILNGENSSLDLSLAKAMYVAGQSYIEVSKDAKESETAEKITYTITDDKNVQTTLEDEVHDKSYSYAKVKEKNGEIVDNYTVDNDSKTPEKTPVQDYRTGEAISIKSNQLVYIPTGNVKDDENGLYVSLPAQLRDLDIYKDIWDDFDKIPIVKTVVSGKTYYFFDFSKVKLKDKNVMNQFIADYAALFDEATKADNTNGLTTGEAYGLVNITDYDFFQVKMLKVSTATGEDAYANIYTNSAITTKVDGTFTIKASSSNSAPLLKAVSNINTAINNSGNGSQKIGVGVGEEASITATKVTNKLQDQYKEVKWLLTNECSNGDYVTEAHALKEEVITPINHFFDFSKITSETSKYCAMKSGYGVWISEGDVVVGAEKFKIGSNSEKSYDTPFKNGKVRGIVFAKGDVSFNDDVEEFEGIIVTGGKIIIDNFTTTKKTMSFLANEEIVKTVLRECDQSRGEPKDSNFGFVCDIFRLFKSQYIPESPTETPTESLKDVTAVQFEDILSFRNWKKNVD